MQIFGQRKTHRCLTQRPVLLCIFVFYNSIMIKKAFPLFLICDWYGTCLWKGCATACLQKNKGGLFLAQCHDYFLMSCLHLFIHLFNKYLLSAYYGQGPTLGSIDERLTLRRSYLVLPEKLKKHSKGWYKCGPSKMLKAFILNSGGWIGIELKPFQSQRAWTPLMNPGILEWRSHNRIRCWVYMPDIIIFFLNDEIET